MKCSVEVVTKKIILTHFQKFKQPVSVNELDDLVQQAVGSGYSSVEFSSVVKKLKDGKAVVERPAGFLMPTYNDVEV